MTPTLEPGPLKTSSSRRTRSCSTLKEQPPLLPCKCSSGVSRFDSCHQYLNSYQDNGKVIITTNEGVTQHTQIRGCPQGFCSGPALWNLVAQGALNYNYSADVHLQAFTDDFLFVVAADIERALGR
ncbi:hypothetical protein AVEN_88087-1 [Araneus ventricosus]|uniref:Reverse transcriptase domain-containing protein n=1 Tax=Araneus ventricosus TaxID=182803 RepID=A0A4Y2NFW5_ARAVE|nr:hypothetical protein AVEN_88087-1 [Araneus ventricosus]